MTPAELRAIAKVVREGTDIRYDRVVVADHILSTVREDDDEPVTEHLIRTVIPCDDFDDEGEVKGTIGDLSWCKYSDQLCLYVCGNGIGWKAMTRRQLRDLCRGLGIDLSK